MRDGCGGEDRNGSCNQDEVGHAGKRCGAVVLSGSGSAGRGPVRVLDRERAKTTAAGGGFRGGIEL